MGRQAFITHNEVIELFKLCTEINGTNKKRSVVSRPTVDISWEGSANLIKVKVIDPKPSDSTLRMFRFYTDDYPDGLSDYEECMKTLKEISKQMTKEHIRRIEEHVREEHCL